MESNLCPAYGKLITILSIDGGGVRGIIPAVLLAELERQIQIEAKNDDARLAEYFDVIAGTSTGGLITSMLTAPNENNRPIYKANEIVDFYMTECPKIFPQKAIDLSGWVGPKYDREGLREAAKKLGTRRLRETLTNVVIPAFDVKEVDPILFSSYTHDDTLKNAYLSDICLATSAAPTFFAAHAFQTSDSEPYAFETTRQFNAIDGGIATNNPAMAAISEVTKQITCENKDFENCEALNFNRILLISLGTGSNQGESKFSAGEVSEWGPLGWISGNNPIITFFMAGSADMVDYYISAFFQARHAQENYLRITDHGLTGDLAMVDKATPENLENLKIVGEQLLEKPVSIHSFDSGRHELPIPNGGTNKEALKRFAKKLVEEKKCRRDTFRAR